MDIEHVNLADWQQKEGDRNKWPTAQNKVQVKANGSVQLGSYDFVSVHQHWI